MKHIYTRTVLIVLIYALILTACKVPDENAQATLSAVGDAAQEAIDAQLAAGIVLSNLPPLADGQVMASQVGSSLWAIDRAIHSMPDARIYIQAGKDIALFVSPGAKDASGASYWFFGFVDVSKRSLIAVSDQLRLGGNFVNCKTMSDFMKAVENAGFKRVDPKTVPTLVAFLKLAIQYMKQSSAAMINTVRSMPPAILIVPAGLLSPTEMYPWCIDDPSACASIED